MKVMIEPHLSRDTIYLVEYYICVGLCKNNIQYKKNSPCKET